MPFAGFQDFKACITSQRKKGHSMERSRKICGFLKSKFEKSETPGLVLSSRHAKLLSEGEIGAVVKTTEIKKNIHSDLCFLSGNYAYGIIQLGNSKKINLHEFKKLRNIHKIEDSERREWWGNTKEFFYYPVKVVGLFEDPLRISMADDNQIFTVPNFLSDNEIEEDLIHLSENYNAEKMETEILHEHWRILSDWNRSKIKEMSENNIISLATKIAGELQKREEVIQETSLFSLIMQELKKSKAFVDQRFNLTLLERLSDSDVIRSFISLSGPVAHGVKSPQTFDFVIQMPEPAEPVKKLVENLLVKMIDNEFGIGNKCTFSWGISPGEEFIPLFDLKLSAIRPLQKIIMGNKVELVSLFNPINLSEPESFVDVNRVVERCYGT